MDGGDADKAAARKPLCGPLAADPLPLYLTHVKETLRNIKNKNKDNPWLLV